MTVRDGTNRPLAAVDRRGATTTTRDEMLGGEHMLHADVRLLGRLLGEAIRSQQGEATFEIIERIRRLSIETHRDGGEAASRELLALFGSLSQQETTAAIRAFTYFLHLANIAEDQHHIRTIRALSSTAPPLREGTLARALAEARAAGISPTELHTFFARALISPVLTAHPTDVRRRSTLDREREIAILLAERDQRCAGPEGAAANEEAL